LEVCAHPVLKYFSVTPPENSGGAENSTENSGPHAKNFFCSMYEMSQRHPVWVAENHVKPCNSEKSGIFWKMPGILGKCPAFLNSSSFCPLKKKLNK
jgi:hypothetical protein